MKTWKFEALWNTERWIRPAYLRTTEQGLVDAVSSSPFGDESVDEEVAGLVIPGCVNAHSHAFQFAMAGLAEHLPAGASSDDFWSWREAMYSLALSIDPDQMQAVATKLYAEMARAGYTHVVEFHYLHNDLDGAVYTNRAEMGERLCAAAKQAGIRITLVPIYYQQGDFNSAATLRQRRFLSKDPDDFVALVEASRKAASQYDKADLGYGIHSLRAAASDSVAPVFGLFPDLPKHIHLSEQTKEVEDCQNATGKRPVQWLLDSVPVDESFNLVHATHLDSNEIAGIVRAEATVVLCPTTEANLGDGVFALDDFMRQGGRWSIGTDSHISLSFSQELRTLEYGQRLSQRKRNVACLSPGEDCGEILLRSALQNGPTATQAPSNPDFFAKDTPFDAVVIDLKPELMLYTSLERALSTFVFADHASKLLGTIVSGEWVVRDHRHSKEDLIAREFSEQISTLRTS